MRARFSGWLFDESARTLRRWAEPVHLSPKAFDLLGLLIARFPDAVPKAEIRKRLWSAMYVSDSNLTKVVREIRSVLGDDARKPRFVRTVHRYGYAFVGEVARDSPARVSRRGPVRARLSWNGRTLRLQEGENEIGRTEESELQVDASTISRRHARITIEGERAMLEDLGSKNGTFHRGERLTAPAELRYGDVLHLGSELMTYERLSDAERTETGGPD